MSDLISREALIDVIEKQKIDNDAYCRLCIDSMKELIEEQPSVTDTNVGGKWVPCSEKMPEGCEDEELEVLVCTKEKYIEAEFDEAGFALYYPGEKKFRSVYNHSADITENVIAWMELPEPYKGERHETD